MNVRWLRLCLIALILTGITAAILWDRYELDREFAEVTRLLRTARLQALSDNRRVIVRFGNGEITTSCGQCLSVPCLCEVRYDTILGPNMIVFDGQGTSRYNVRIHGGDMTLMSYSGLFQRHIAVNCTGLVRESVYPDPE